MIRNYGLPAPVNTFAINLRLLTLFLRKNHINKVMMMAITAFAFMDGIENGEEAVKLGIFRAQSYKVAEKEVQEPARQADGSSKQTGPIKRKRDNLYLIDCAVTSRNRCCQWIRCCR